MDKCYIFSDSQAAIKAIRNPARQSGQFIISKILDNIENLRVQNPSMYIYLQWIPGHHNIEGNEQADMAAKAAASNKNQISQKHPSLKAAQQMHI